MVPDLRYTLGFYAPDSVVMLQTVDRRMVVVPGLEEGRAKRQTQRVEVFTPSSMKLSRKRKRDVNEWALALLNIAQVKRVFVPEWLPTGMTEFLRRRGIKIDVLKGVVFPERATKSPQEVLKIRESQQAAVIAMRAAIRRISTATVDSEGILRSGKKRIESSDLRHLIEEVLLQQNCMAESTIAACGKQAVDPHEAGSGPIRAGEPIVIDIFPRHKEHGYWGDLTRTVVKGYASKKIVKIYRAVKAAQRAALEKVRPRVKVRTVHREAVRVFEERGFRTELIDGRLTGFIHGTGGGIRLEDTVLVTETGWRYLCPCEKKLNV